ncbi:MAG: zinc-dependent dehydrogenase [Promicromonosporaceae bacterium]|nr:zinc-dependent dehydrogenase [Promicromonosporaceae bacterium]
MQVFKFYAPGDVRLEDAPEPTPGPGEIKLRVRATSMCGTDVKISTAGHQRMEPNRVMGHEIAGEIAELGEGVTGWAVGDRVQVIAAIPCGECDWCRAGIETICPNQLSMGYQFDGGFAPYLIVPPQVMKVDGLNRIPDGVGFAEASVAEPFACAINAQELVNTHDGDTVVVIGSGPIGCLHVRLARARGAKQVFLVELHRERLDLAANVVQPDAAICSAEEDPIAKVRELTDGRGVDVVITAAAAGITQEQGLQMLAPRGRISLFGGLPKDKPTITLDSNLVHYKELSIWGANGSSPAQNKKALSLIADGSVPVTDLITHKLPLDQITAGLDVVKNGTGIKVTIEP